MCNHKFDDWQNTLLSTTGAIIIFMLLINLAFIIYNILKFLIPMKIKSWLLLLFYALATIMLVARVVELFYIIIPDDDCVSITDVTSFG